MGLVGSRRAPVHKAMADTMVAVLGPDSAVSGAAWAEKGVKNESMVSKAKFRTAGGGEI